MEVVEDFESRPHKAVSFLVEREEKIQEWNEQKMPKVLPGYSEGTLPGRNTKDKGREEGELDDDSEERKSRRDIAQDVVAGIKEKASRPHKEQSGSVKRSWDSSQIENEEEQE